MTSFSCRRDVPGPFFRFFLCVLFLLPSRVRAESSPFDVQDLSSKESTPVPKDPCRREDLNNFDDFEACRVDEETHAPAPAVTTPEVTTPAAPSPPVAAAETEKAPGLRAKEKPQPKRDQVGLALVITGGILLAGGIAMMIVGLIRPKTTRSRQATWPRDTCVTGKPCGDACIDPSDTCHMGGSSGGGLGDDPLIARPGVFGGGVVAVTAGAIGLYIGSRRLRQMACQRPLQVRFDGISVRF